MDSKAKALADTRHVDVVRAVTQAHDIAAAAEIEGVMAANSVRR